MDSKTIIYQGEPIEFELNGKTDGGQYIPSFAGESYEAIMTSNCNKMVRGWSTTKGTMTIGVKVVEGTSIGYISWGMNGEETAKIPQGEYSLEVAKVVSNANGNRAIGVLEGAIIVKCARIREGV